MLSRFRYAQLFFSWLIRVYRHCRRIDGSQMRLDGNTSKRIWGMDRFEHLPVGSMSICRKFVGIYVTNVISFPELLRIAGTPPGCHPNTDVTS